MTVFYGPNAYDRGGLVTHYQFPMSAQSTKPDERFCTIVSSSESDYHESGMVYHAEAKEFKSVSALMDALGTSIEKIEVKESTYRGGGGFSTPADVSLVLQDGRRIQTTFEIGKTLCGKKIGEKARTDDWTGAGYSFGVYAPKKNIFQRLRHFG